MARSLSFKFANKNDLFNFCHWDCVIDTVIDSLDQNGTFLVIFCPQPSLLTNRLARPSLIISGSHPEEVLQLFDTQSQMLLGSARTVKFCIVDVPSKSIANIWQKVLLFERFISSATAVQSVAVEVLAPCVNFASRHALERVNFLHRAVPVHLI